MNKEIISFNSGEMTPETDALDIEKYAAGCRHLENMIPRIYGDAERRPGTVRVDSSSTVYETISYTPTTEDPGSILSMVIAWENQVVCYENEVVEIPSDDHDLPSYVCADNDIVCWEDTTQVLLESADGYEVAGCRENLTLFYENEMVVIYTPVDQWSRRLAGLADTQEITQFRDVTNIIFESGNDFSGDDNCIALWQFEPSDLFADSKGTNTLLPQPGQDPTSDTVKHKEGSGSISFAKTGGGTNHQRAYMASGTFDAGFPLDLGDADSKISVATWLRLSSVDDDNNFFYKKTMTGPAPGFVPVSFVLNANVTNGVSIWVYNAGWDITTFGTGLSVNVWYHAIVTYDGISGEYRIRVWDDTAKEFLSDDVTGTMLATGIGASGALSVGNGQAPVSTQCFTGNLDELVIFNDILTEEEMSDIRLYIFAAQIITVGTTTTGTGAEGGIYTCFYEHTQDEDGDNGVTVPTTGAHWVDYWVIGDGLKMRMIPFIYSSEIAYPVELGHLYARFYYNKAVLENDDDEEVVIMTPYEQGDLFELHTDQIADTMWVVHSDYAQRKLTRTTVTSFSLDEIEYEGGPFKIRNDIQNDDDITMTYDHATDLVAVGSEGTLTASSPVFVDGHIGGLWGLNYPKDLTISEGSLTSAAEICEPISVKGTAAFKTHGTWTGTIVLYRNDNDTGWDIYRTYIGKNDRNDAYTWTENSDNIQYKAVVTSWTSGTINAEITVNDTTITGVVRVDSLDSSTVANVTVMTALPATNGLVATERWSEAAWSPLRGYPCSITFLGERCIYVGTDTVWFSKVGSYEKFEEGTKDADSFSVVIPSTNPIRWIKTLGEVLVVGTSGDATIGGVAVRSSSMAGTIGIAATA